MTDPGINDADRNTVTVKDVITIIIISHCYEALYMFILISKEVFHTVIHSHNVVNRVILKLFSSSGYVR